MLTEVEIQKIYSFVQKRNVVYIDVQIELVDHLASEIESIQIENPSIDFRTALTTASQKFNETSYALKPFIGKTRYTKGYKGLVLQKSILSTKYLTKRMSDYLLNFFKPPRIILTLSIWIIIFKLIEFGEIKNVAKLGAIFLSLAFAYWVIRKLLFQKVYGKFMSLASQPFTLLYFGTFCQGYLIKQFINWLDSATFYFPIVASSLFTLWILSIYIGFIYFTDLLISEIKEKYCHHKLNIV